MTQKHEGGLIVKKTSGTAKRKKAKNENESSASDNDELMKLKHALSEKDEMIKRLQADFDNYRKFVEREKENLVLVASAGIMKDMLIILDDLEAAASNEKNEETKKGFESLAFKMLSILKKHGLEPISAKGEKFDPNVHEALMQEKSDGEKGIILEELQKGYILNGKILRHPKVKISI